VGLRHGPHGEAGIAPYGSLGRKEVKERPHAGAVAGARAGANTHCGEERPQIRRRHLLELVTSTRGQKAQDVPGRSGTRARCLGSSLGGRTWRESPLPPRRPSLVITQKQAATAYQLLGVGGEARAKPEAELARGRAGCCHRSGRRRGRRRKRRRPPGRLSVPQDPAPAA
jgi:hypothetical protein